MKFIQLASIVFLFFLTFKNVQGQENSDWRIYAPDNKNTVDPTVLEKSERGFTPQRPGHVKMIEDPRIAELNRKKKENPTKLDGYRVQLFFGDRSKAQEIRGDFIREYPNTAAYISYLAPNFRLRVGDFRSRLACEKFKHQLGSEYSGSYIVKDKIELPPLYGDSDSLEADK